VAERTTIRLLFADRGVYHHEDVSVPSEALARYERVVDMLREDPDVLRELYVNPKRLCAAYVVKDGEPA